jgi:salicylate hydroxylase
MMLLGDAAHASTPHQGAGAGMCIEDALVMGELMSMVADENDFQVAFEVFEEMRRERVLNLVETSREAGKLYDFEGEEIGDDVGKIREILEKRMKWIWEIDLNQHVEEVKSRMREKLHERT